MALSLLFPLSTAIYAGSQPGSPVGIDSQFPLSLTKTPPHFSGPPLTSPLHVSTSSGSLLSPTTEQSDGQIPRQAKYKWIKEMLEAYPRLKNLSEGAEIEIFEEMSGDHIQRFIAASFSLYPNIQGFDINTFKLLFRTLKTISVRGDNDFTRALGVMSCAHDPKERLHLYEAMGISIDDMNNTEYAERLDFAEKHAHQPSTCFYLFAIHAMTKPIEEVRKNC